MVDPKALGNEPASPVAGATETVQVNPSQQEGLSKREYFAGLAMAGYLANPDTGGESSELICSWAIGQADALLAALAKDGQP